MTQDVRPSAPPLAIRVGLRLAVVLAACGCGGRGASAHRALPQIEYQGGKVVLAWRNRQRHLLRATR